MANVNAPNGLSPVRYANGAPYNGAANLYVILAADTDQYGLGDVVIPAPDADANGVPAVKKATATSANPIGVIVGIDPVLTDGLSLVGGALSLETIALPATKTRAHYVLVADDPGIIFEAQANNTTTQTAAATINQNAKIVVANPATGSPVSGSYLDNTSFATTNSHMFRVLGLTRKPGADFTAYARFLVMFNIHVRNGTATGAS